MQFLYTDVCDYCWSYYKYTVLTRNCTPSIISPPLLFAKNVCGGIFISNLSPPYVQFTALWVLLIQKSTANDGNTVDREIFALKIIRVKIFRVDKLSLFRSIHEILLTVDNCNMDECLESLWLLVYYQVSGELEIVRCSHRSDIYLEECGLAHKLIHWASLRNFSSV